MYGTIGNPLLIGDMVIEARNFPDRYLEYEYKESKDITQDLINLIKACVKYELFFRWTAPTSKKQTFYIDTDGRLKALTENNNKTKGNSQIQVSRLKYIVAHGKHLGIKAIKRILHDRHKIKTIDIDHWDNDTTNNKLSNLKATPHKVNIDSDYDKLKRLIDSKQIHKAKEYANKIGKENFLLFLF